MEINLLQEEVAQLKELKERTEKLTFSLGEIRVQEIRLGLLQEALKEELKDIINKEQTLSDALVSKYGAISINLEKGTASKIE